MTSEQHKFDSNKVDILLAKASALADLIGCASLSETDPSRDSIPMVTMQLGDIVKEIRETIFPDIAPADEGVAS